MKPLLKILLLWLFPFIGIAQWQQKQLDSLQFALRHATNDTIRMALYQNLSDYYKEVQRDSSLHFSEQQLLLSEKLKIKLFEADALVAMGYLYRGFGNHPMALQSLLKALKITEDPASETTAWKFSNDETPRVARLRLLSENHRVLGMVYGANRNREQQLLHYRQSQKFASESNDITQLSMVSMQVGFIYFRPNQLDSALAFELKALEYNNQSPNKKYRGRIYNALGKIYYRKGDYTQAKQYLYEAIQASRQYYNLASLGDAYIDIAEIFTYKTVDKDSSLWYAKKGLEIFQSMGSASGIINSYTHLSSIYKLRNNMDSAFKYQALAFAAKDSINNAEKIKQFQNIGFDEQMRLRQLEEEKIQTQNKIRTYALLAGLGIFSIIAFILFRNNRQKQKANTILEKTLSELKTTQSQLIQSEKMASLGELTAGIAHEIQNPLNFFNNFSEVNIELVEEMKSELATGNGQQAIEIADDIKENLEKISHHGKRADAIVKGMLQHSRASSGKKEPTDINALADEYLRLAYHGLRAKDKSFNANFTTAFNETVGKIDIMPQDIGRVLLNLLNNAFYSVNKKKKQLNGTFEPTVSVTTKKINDKIEIIIKDNGMGIPQKVLDKIFQPFFTTKPTGEGTGLGLSMSYDIIKAHGGELKVNTEEGNFAEFIVTLPII